MIQHDIFDVVGGHQDADIIYVDWADVRKACWNCHLLEADERPATECPAERWNLMARLLGAMRRAQAVRPGEPQPLPGVIGRLCAPVPAFASDPAAPRA
ncbi:hypothetical protein ACFXPX_36815 [Kitasatospora sp. NPDC059146]|uniref:hypothetical protein n=1 Tax=unclassified Kitasatospora TaxID=2633591 RepID=UPI0036A71387